MSDGTAEDNTFEVQKPAGGGEVTSEYFKTELKPLVITSKNGVQWTEVTEAGEDTVEVQLPGNIVKYFHYSYDLPTGYSVISERINDTLAGADVSNVEFRDIITNSGREFGGAIYNTQDNSTLDITASFVNNKLEKSNVYSYGGAISNSGKLGNLKADFIGNTVVTGESNSAYGGAIHNGLHDSWSGPTSNAEIKSINGNFINNKAINYGYGGAISNNPGARIGNITGDFINNFANNYAGAIYNSRGYIGDITGDFIGNYVEDYYGGAIYNNRGNIGNIKGNFIGNHAGKSSSYGGAIYNYDGMITSITGDFIGNYSKSENSSYAGAIMNTGIIGNINGNFIGNYSDGGSVYGGAIYSQGFVGNLTGDFIGNWGRGVFLFGAAMYNSSKAGNITGDYIGNYILSDEGGVYGTALYVNNVGDINGNFIGNYSIVGNTTNGTLNINGTGGNITGNFIGNHGSGCNNWGAGINTRTSIGNITGNFIGNYLVSDTSLYSSPSSNGAAIKASGTVGNITGDFIGNYCESIYSYGGAIYNSSGKIGNITGNFINNYVKGKMYDYSQNNSTSANGGAIQSYAPIGEVDSVTGEVIGGLINCNFYNNYADNYYYQAVGGAIHAGSDLNIIADNFRSEFIGNYTLTAGVKDDNAIAVNKDATLTLKAINNGHIFFADNIKNAFFVTNDNIGYGLKLTGDGTGTISLHNTVSGAAASATNILIDMQDSVMRDYDLYSLDSNKDTARWNIDIDLENKTSDTITTSNALDVANNRVVLKNLNILNADKAQVNEDYKIQVLVNPENNSNLQLALGDEINLPDEEQLLSTVQHVTIDALKQATNWQDKYTTQTDTIKTYGILNLATTATTNDSIGVHVTNQDIKTEVSSSGDTLALVVQTDDLDEKNFYFDTAEDEYIATANLGELKNTLTIDGVSGEETSSTINLDSHSGFVMTQDSILNIHDVVIKNGQSELGAVINSDVIDAEVNLTNVSLIDNTVSGDHGGAVYSSSDVNLTADAGDVLISGNKTSKDDEAVYMYRGAEFKLNSVNGGEITVDDKIGGERGYNLTLTGDESGKINLNNSVDNAIVNIDSVYLHLNGAEQFKTSNINMNSGTLDLINDSAQQQVAESFIINGSFNMNIDADLANVKMDRLPKNTTTMPGFNINVDKINLVSDSKTESVAIPFAYYQFKDNVKYIGPDKLSKDTQVTTAYAPIYKYSVKYENRDDLGYFVFNRGGGSSGNASDAFNPAVLSSPVAAQAGATATMNQAFNYAFQNSDNFMNIPYLERIGHKYDNRYALSPTGDATDVGTFSPLFTDKDKSSIWVKPYASFENIPLKNGPKVSNITYGTIIGYDTDLTSMKRGWERVWTGYIGYNGASQRYSGVDTTQNGGLLGATLTLYKGNFFNATTISAGASVAENSNMYGHDNFTMLIAGVGNKTGYNFEFKEGRYIIQPNMLISYTFVNTFDYTNAAGVKIKSDPLNAIQLAPGVKFIGNFRGGWQPYIGVNMIWNILDKSDVTANTTKLPEMSIKPYVQYGVGVQKRFKDNCMAYGQAMIQNGGRNGISLTAGFRWSLGKDGKAVNEKVQNSDQKTARTVLKQMTTAQKTAFGKKLQNTTRTTNAGVLKQL